MRAPDRDPSGMETVAQPLEEAFDRLADFLAVWSDGITPEAIGCLLESVGLDADVCAAFSGRLDEVQPGAPAPAVLLGLLLGLTAAQCQIARGGGDQTA